MISDMDKSKDGKRKWVKVKERDGTLKYKHPTEYTMILIREEGSKAELKKIPRYYNPWMAERARMWTIGWNKSHGYCRKCSLCMVGNKKIKKINDKKEIKKRRR
jgi:hypothetical protein